MLTKEPVKCLNCSRVIVKKLLKGRGVLLPKTCPWCLQHAAKRQSLRAPKERRK